jgi:heme-degrading monooxygenase HmoA
MYAIIYTFKVKDGMEKTFIQSWKTLTQLIYKYEGSLGSRLHKSEDSIYVAYAQWPNKETFNKADSNLPDEANEVRKKMRESCIEIQTLYNMDVVEDLLKNE